MSNKAKSLLEKMAQHWEAEESSVTTGQTTGQEPLLVAETDAIAEDEPPFDDVEPGFCAKVGTSLCGWQCADVDRGARRLVYLVRHYPFRPYLVHGGGSGIHLAAGPEWREQHAELEKEFCRLWWSAAGDAVIARYRDKLPLMDDGWPPKLYQSKRIKRG